VAKKNPPHWHGQDSEDILDWEAGCLPIMKYDAVVIPQVEFFFKQQQSFSSQFIIRTENLLLQMGTKLCQSVYSQP